MADNQSTGGPDRGEVLRAFMTGGEPTGDEVNAFIDSLVAAEPLPGEDVTLPPRDTPIMVVRSLRMPFELIERIDAVAKGRGVPASTLMREWIELELTAIEDDQPISRADALRALAGLRPIGDAGTAA